MPSYKYISSFFSIIFFDEGSGVLSNRCGFL